MPVIYQKCCKSVSNMFVKLWKLHSSSLTIKSLKLHAPTLMALSRRVSSHEVGMAYGRKVSVVDGQR